MLSTVAQDIECTFVAGAGVTDFVVRKDEAVPNPDGSVTVKFADVQSEEKRHVLVSATLPMSAKKNGAFPMFKATVKYRNLVREIDENKVIDCLVNRNGKEGTANQNVDVSRNRIIATEAMSRAEELGDRDELAKARKTIQESLDVIKASVSADNKFCIGLINDLNNCLEGLRDRNQYRNVTKQYMTQNIMCHKVERACNFDADFASQMTYNNESRAVTMDTWGRADSLDSCDEDFSDDYQDTLPQQYQNSTYPAYQQQMQPRMQQQYSADLQLPNLQAFNPAEQS
jgi:hypothetical protein